MAGTERRRPWGMRTHHIRTALAVATLLVLVAACSSGEATTTTPPSSSEGDPNADKLAQVLDRGTLVLSTDLAYPPQSYAVEGASRLEPTVCTPGQLTASEVDGYDVQTGITVAEALGVEPCFVTPTWTEITAGNWGDRWDVSWGSGAINADRMERLYMTQPYYSDEQVFYVRDDSPITDASDLSGMTVGACAACTHQLYLEGTLEVPGVDIEFFLDDPEIVLFDVERPGLKAVAQGKIDAFICANPVGEQAIDEGLPLRPLEPVPFDLYATGFIDRSSNLDQRAFVERINEAVRQAHADGTLAALSEEFFGTDYASKAAAFDLDAIGQEVE